MKENSKRWGIFLLLALLLVGLDQFTKQLAVEHLMGANRVPIIRNVLYLLYIEIGRAHV